MRELTTVLLKRRKQEKKKKKVSHLFRLIIVGRKITSFYQGMISMMQHSLLLDLEKES